MVVDEQGFRSFIANVDKYITSSQPKKLQDTEAYEDLEIRLKNKLFLYIQMLETPKPSKWKQLKLIA